MKKSNVRVWFTVLLISIGALCLRAIWAEPIGPQRPTDIDCLNSLNGCWNVCENKNQGDYGSKCRDECAQGYFDCRSLINVDSVGAGAPGQIRPPNAQGPNPTPIPTPTNPTGLPITGSPPSNAAGPNPTASVAPPSFPQPTRAPVSIFGPKPSPSPTANPILFDRPAQPTPTPTPKHHRTAIKKASPTPSPHGHTSTPTPSPHGHKPSPTPSPKPTPREQHHHHPE
jgi:hypothetical protein